MKLVTVLGARPQFIKAAPVSAAIRARNGICASRQINEVIVHTGQHYDANMSEVFFKQLEVPDPNYHLGVGSLTHGAMTGRMLEAVEGILQSESPDWVLVYGDTNSTLAGALAASKLSIPVAHVEAGLRSDNPRMPEEINRVVTDRISTLLLCPTARAVENLRAEAFPFPTAHSMAQRISWVGDVMYDLLRKHYNSIIRRPDLDRWNLREKGYVLCTVHRQENTDDPNRLTQILGALRVIASTIPVVCPMHPRLRRRIEQLIEPGWPSEVRVMEPLPYLEMQRLEAGARTIITDSGGVQKEAYFHGVPCVTLRDETEWSETVETGWNRLAGASMEGILEAFAASEGPPSDRPQLFGAGDAADRIVDELWGGPLAP